MLPSWRPTATTRGSTCTLDVDRLDLDVTADADDDLDAPQRRVPRPFASRDDAEVGVAS